MRRVVRTVAKLDVERADRVLEMTGVDPECRPETLSPEDFARLLRAIKAAQRSRDQGL
jgi:16S rRNA (adenine1518-N6/adenine1519-N6)-dimethyltransferase